MFVAYSFIALALSGALAWSAALKLSHAEAAMQSIHEVVGIPLSWFPFLAGCELAGALGLLLGFGWAPIGIAAALGVVIYMVGAVVSHLRVAEYKNVVSPAVPLVLAIAALVTRALSI